MEVFCSYYMEKRYIKDINQASLYSIFDLQPFARTITHGYPKWLLKKTFDSYKTSYKNYNNNIYNKNNSDTNINNLYDKIVHNLKPCKGKNGINLTKSIKTSTKKRYLKNIMLKIILTGTKSSLIKMISIHDLY